MQQIKLSLNILHWSFILNSSVQSVAYCCIYCYSYCYHYPHDYHYRHLCRHHIHHHHCMLYVFVWASIVPCWNGDPKVKKENKPVNQTKKCITFSVSHSAVMCYSTMICIIQALQQSDCRILDYFSANNVYTQIAKFMGPTWGPSGSCRPQMYPMLDPWTLLSG